MQRQQRFMQGVAAQSTVPPAKCVATARGPTCGSRAAATCSGRPLGEVLVVGHAVEGATAAAADTDGEQEQTARGAVDVYSIHVECARHCEDSMQQALG